jgi:nucleotide-binding universal stress UspA family protein
MRRIVVPLDGTSEAASVIPHARLLMGQGGELILIRDADWVVPDHGAGLHVDRRVAEDADDYLKGVATTLRDEGVTVRVLGTGASVAGDIESAVSQGNVGMIALAMRGRDPSLDLRWNSTLRKALAQARMPILLCSPDAVPEFSEMSRRRLLVPLDGSETAAAALPLAEELAQSWHAPLWLTHIVWWDAPSDAEDLGRSEAYLRAIARDLDCDARINIVVGRSAWTMLTREVIDRMVTDVVMTSHGRTGSSRVTVGSVAEKMIRHLQCRIFMITPTASESIQRARSSSSTVLFSWSSRKVDANRAMQEQRSYAH